MPSGLKNKMVNEAHRHHHQGQNRPHQKAITHPQGPPPPEPLEPYNELFGGSEGLIGPRLDCKNIPVVELLLYYWHYQYQCTAKDKEI